jgi:hypothetical protein
LYREGRGVPQDYVHAYRWSSRAAANSDSSYREDATKELFAVAKELPPGTVLDPPLPPGPFKLKLDRWWDWFRTTLGYVLGSWFGVAMLTGFGMVLREKMYSVRARRKAEQQKG